MSRFLVVRSGLVVVLAALSVSVILAGDVVIVDDSTQPWKSRRFEKLLVIGITDDQAVRHRFEDKFVSQLRGHGIEGVTSYSLVADLGNVDDPAAVAGRLMEQGVDGAITVRLCRFTGKESSEWTETWVEEITKETTLRQLVESSLPVRREGGGGYGVDVALWEGRGWERIWVGRTEVHPIKKLRKGATTFVQSVIVTLKDRGRI